MPAVRVHLGVAKNGDNAAAADDRRREGCAVRPRYRAACQLRYPTVSAVQRGAARGAVQQPGLVWSVDLSVADGGSGHPRRRPHPGAIRVV